MHIVDDPFVFGQIAAANAPSIFMQWEQTNFAHFGLPIKKYPLTWPKIWQVVLIYAQAESHLRVDTVLMMQSKVWFVCDETVHPQGMEK